MELELKEFAAKANATLSELRQAVETKASADVVARIETALTDIEEKRSDLESKFRDLELANARLEGMGGATKSADDISEIKSAFAAWMKNPKNEEAKSALLNVKDAVTYQNQTGGFAVPEKISDIIKRMPGTQSVIRELSNYVYVDKGVGTLKEIIEVGEAGAEWIAEGAARNDTDGAEFDVSIPSFGYMAARHNVSDELLADSIADFVTTTWDSLARGFARAEAKAFLVGTGASNDPAVASQPQGILTSNKLKLFKTGQANTLGAAGFAVGDMILNLTGEIDPAYHGEAVFIMNHKTKILVSQIKNSNNDYIFKDSVVAGQPATLWGFPVRIDSAMPDVAAGSTPILFGSLRDGYTVADKAGLNFLTDDISRLGVRRYIGKKRVGGGIRDARALVAVKVAQ